MTEAATPCRHARIRRTGDAWVCSVCGEQAPSSAGFPALGPEPRPWSRIPPQGLVVWAVTLVASVLIAWLLPLVHFIFATFGVLCHEIGHTVVALATGHLAIPSFDLLHGGGVTLIFDRSWWLAGLDVALPCVAAYRYRSSRLVVIAGVTLSAVLLLLMLSGWDVALGLEMGHGGQLVAAGICLFLALAGTTRPVDRWLYGLLGWSVGMDVVTLCWSLIHDPDALAAYYDGKDGVDNDFVRIAEDCLGCSVAAVAWANLALCALMPGLALAWLMFVRDFLARLVRRP